MSLSIAQIPDSAFFAFLMPVESQIIRSGGYNFLAYYWGKFCGRISERKMGVFPASEDWTLPRAFLFKDFHLSMRPSEHAN
jgi:hypothetical protein